MGNCEAIAERVSHEDKEKIEDILRNIDNWTFDIFELAETTNGHPLKYVGFSVLNSYDLIQKFKIAPNVLENFLKRLEEGYCRKNNPYHNNLHGADVCQTMHYMVSQTGLMNWLTDLEILAALLAAIVHDYEHAGFTNNFLVETGADVAMIYNDRSVQENHHISGAFRLLKEDDCNVLSNLSREEYRKFRALVIALVLATDMSSHSEQLEEMKSSLTQPEAKVDKSKVLSLLLHCCDISHCCKKWKFHHRWTMMIVEEFYHQGDLERELGLPITHLCDRLTNVIPEEAISFIDFIIYPCFTVMSDMLEHVLASSASMCDSEDIESTESAIAVAPQSYTAAPQTSTAASKQKFSIQKPWFTFVAENRKVWNEEIIKIKKNI